MRFKIIQDLLKIFDFVGKKRRLYFLFLQILSIFSSMLDTISVGSIAPFIAIVTNANAMMSNKYIKIGMTYLSLSNASQLIKISTAIFALILIFTALIKWWITYYSLKFTSNISNELALKLYKITLYQPYITHTQRNSSEFIAGISKASELLEKVINPVFIFINSFFTVLLISAFLILLNPIIITTTLIVLVLFYLIISLSTKKLLKSESIRITEMNPKIHRYMQEGIGGIREIILDGTQEVFSEKFGFLDGIRRIANLKIHIISSTPNAFMQTFGIILIAFLASNTGESHQMNSSLPLMGALAFGFLRISPALQSIYSSWVSISSGRVTLDYILNFFNESPAYLGRANHSKPIEFLREIKLKNIFFRYSENLPFVIKDMTLSINKGDRIGLAGMTGNGKSTLCDIIMGLLDATSGTLQVDDKIIDLDNLRSWQSHIAHVPQSIFLSDSTIAENIAFGVPQEEIDYDKVVLAAQQAQISKTIEEWETGYNTLVGERGIRLSGGQRQRIGIARALYKEADVIIFDEATSALDSETELEVIKAIESLSSNLTIIIIAHRTTTLKNCNKVYEMVDNNIVEKKSK